MVTFSRALPLVLCVVWLAVASCGRPPVLPDADVLAAQAIIRRDTFGVPHILAQTEEAAAFAFGYAQAEDHAEHIGMRYISARGQAAFYFGSEGIENDFRMAHFDNLAEAERGLETISDLYRRIIAAYAAGVNRYVATHREKVPAWMPEITAVDVLASTRASAVGSLAGPGLPRRLREKYEKTTEADVEALADAADEWTDRPGSNAFALGGSRTASGKPILLGNPHLNWSSLYWEAHVRVPDRIDFYGSTLVGIPVLRAGFNDRLGFVQTNNAPDLDDVLALELDASRPDHYRFNGRSRPMLARDATIRVRQDDGSVRLESRTFWHTALGPVIYRTPTHVFVVQSTRLDAFGYYEGFYRLARTRSLKEWMAELRKNLVPTSNFTYADADGNILYLWNGRVPIRADGGDYSLDVPVSRSADLWRGLHDVDDLPRLLNPPGGYVQNANNPPAYASLRDPIDMSGFPSYFERGPLALRPQLALDLLERTERATVADVIRLKYNTRMLLAERVKPALLDAVRALASPSEEARTGADALAAWDDRVSAESRGAVLFQEFWDRYSRAVSQPFEAPWSEQNPTSTPSGLSDRAEAVRQLEAAVRATREAYGSESVAWGDVHRFRVGAIDLPGDGASGTYGTFRVMRFANIDGSPHRVAGNLGDGRLEGFGDAWILLVDFAPPVTGWSVLAYGQTTDLGSPHSTDQIRIFAAHDLRRAWYSEEEIRANVTREYRPLRRH